MGSGIRQDSPSSHVPNLGASVQVGIQGAEIVLMHDQMLFRGVGCVCAQLIGKFNCDKYLVA